VVRPVEASAFFPDFTFASQGFHKSVWAKGAKTCHTLLALKGRSANPLQGQGRNARVFGEALLDVGTDWPECLRLRAQGRIR